MTDYNTDRGIWSGPSAEEIKERMIKSQPSQHDWNRFHLIRAEIFKFIAKSLEEDGHCKSYEGGLNVEWPNYFEDKDTSENNGWYTNGSWMITLHCYLLGPSRHYRWIGKSFQECLEKFELDATHWIQGNYNFRHDERE